MGARHAAQLSSSHWMMFDSLGARRCSVLRSLVSTAVAIVWAIILVLVGGRFLALLVDANRDSELVSRLYRHSDFWVKPFVGMFDLSDKTVHATSGVFEPASFFAFIFYFVAGAVVMSILSWSVVPGLGHHHHVSDV
jgi:hypothetical protein